MNVSKITLTFLLIVAVGFLITIPYTTQETLELTVSEKERIVKNDNSKYLIFTDKGVFENTDTIFYFKFDSSDIYGEIKEGKTYQAKVYGFRIPIFSMYKNIIEIK